MKEDLKMQIGLVGLFPLGENRGAEEECFQRRWAHNRSAVQANLLEKFPGVGYETIGNSQLAFQPRVLTNRFVGSEKAQ